MGRRLGSEGTAILPRVRFQDVLLRPLRVNRLLRQVSSGLAPAGESGFTMTNNRAFRIMQEFCDSFFSPHSSVFGLQVPSDGVVSLLVLFTKAAPRLVPLNKSKHVILIAITRIPHL